jgi:hypothetical protein
MHKFLRLLAATASTLALTLPAQAALITFDGGTTYDGAPFAPLMNHTAYVEQNGYVIGMYSTKAGALDSDLVGALVDGTDVATTCSGLVCPTNNNTQFMLALNDGLPDISLASGGAFDVQGFQASYVAAPGDVIPATAMILRLVGFDAVGGVVFQEDFGVAGPTSGVYSFRDYRISGANRSKQINELAFYGFACDSITGNCSRALDKAQFAIDNIAVPEPSSIALVGLALTGLVTLRRRQNKA